MIFLEKLMIELLSLPIISCLIKKYFFLPFDIIYEIGNLYKRISQSSFYLAQ